MLWSLADQKFSPYKRLLLLDRNLALRARAPIKHSESYAATKVIVPIRLIALSLCWEQQTKRAYTFVTELTKEQPKRCNKMAPIHRRV